jgi:pimeloyl-ACP methyl ester carboxylesterase
MGARGVSRQLAELRDLYVADVDQAVRGRWSPVTFEHSLQAMPTDPARQLLFATLVTHYWSHAAFLPDGALLEGLPRIAHIPSVLIHGRLDVSSPAAVPWELHQRWPASRFVLIDEEGHGGPRMLQELIDAIEAFTANTAGPDGQAVTSS